MAWVWCWPFVVRSSKTMEGASGWPTTLPEDAPSVSVSPFRPPEDQGSKMPHSLRSSLQPAPFMPVEPLVCVVDDDDAVRLSIRLLIETLGLEVRSFASALDVLEDSEVLARAHCL